MLPSTVKMQDALRILDLKTRQHLHYYIRRRKITPFKIAGQQENYFLLEDVMKLKEYRESR